MPPKSQTRKAAMTSTAESADKIIQEKLYNDLDMFAVKIIRSDGKNRIKFWNHFEKLHEHFKYKDVGYGRIHNLRALCRLLVTLTVAIESSYDSDIDVNGGIANVSFYKWKEDDFDDIRNVFHSIVNNLYREDADYSPITEDENEELVAERDNVINKRSDKVLRYISVLRAVCPLQESFLTLLNGECTLPDDDILRIDKTILHEVWGAAKEGNDDEVKSVLSTILRNHDSDDDADNIRLMNIGRLRDQLQVKPLSLNLFYHCVNKTVRIWLDKFFINDYDDDDKGEKNERPDQMSASREHIRRLRKVRRLLNAEVDDPLEESYATAVLAVAAAASAGTSSNDEGGPPKRSSCLSPAARKRRPKPLQLSSSPKRKTSEQPTREEPTPEPNAKVAAAASANNGSSHSPKRPRQFSNDGSRHSSSSTSKKRPRMGILFEPKRTAHRLQFGSGGEEEDDDYLSVDSRPDFGLSDLPSKQRRIKISSKQNKKPTPKTQVKKYEGRRFWSVQEKHAIKEGIKQFGPGKWKAVLEKYKIILGDRTSAQIKDCVRTMTNRGEL